MFTHLNRIQTFIAVVDCGSFTHAAGRLFISKAIVSLHVKALEEALGVPLLIRSTRGVALTDAGEVLYHDFKKIFINIQSSLDTVSDSHHALSGTLNLTSTGEFGERYLIPLIGEFCQQHPRLNIHFHTDSSLNDLVTERLDLAIRLGTLRDSALKSRRLGDFSILIVASAKWLENNPVSDPQALNHVSWIANNNLQTPTQWSFTAPDGSQLDIRASARFRANTSAAMKAMVKAGLGVAVLPEWLVREELERGTLRQLIPDYQLPRQDISVVYAGDHRLRLKCRVFIDYLLQHLKI